MTIQTNKKTWCGNVTVFPFFALFVNLFHHTEEARLFDFPTTRFPSSPAIHIRSFTADVERGWVKLKGRV